MRVLHVTQGYFPAIGGTEKMVQEIAEQLVHRHGDQVTVFTTNCYNGEGFWNRKVPRFGVGWDEVNSVRVRRFPVATRLSALLVRPQRFAYRHRLPFNQYLRAWSQGPIVPGLERAIRAWEGEVIVAASFPLLHMFSALRAARATSRPFVYFGALHPDDHWGYDRKMIYRAIRRADAYVALTDYEAGWVVARGADPRRVKVVGLGVDVEAHRGVTPAEARQRYALGDAPVVGFVGQLGGHKGVDTLLRAMPAVWRALPQTRLLLAGARTLYAEEIQRMLAAFPAEQRRQVRLVENFEEAEKPWLFAAVDVFAYPSGYESFGIAFLEAWAAGKPVIGCWRGAVPWVVDSGRDGLLVHYQHDEALSAAVLALLRSPTWAASLGEAGRAKVHAEFTWDRVGEKVRAAYAAALAG